MAMVHSKIQVSNPGPSCSLHVNCHSKLLSSYVCMTETQTKDHLQNHSFIHHLCEITQRKVNHIKLTGSSLNLLIDGPLID